MTWKLRHAGSPQFLDGLTLTQIVEGLADDKFSPSDEVLGPGDQRWTTIESHPQLQDIVAEMEEAQNRVVEEEDADEQRIDMNPLIDVCLVLLVFFILATTMSILEKVLDIPQSKTERVGNIRKVRMEDIISSTIMVKAYKEAGKTVVKLEDKPVPIEDLQNHLDSHVRDTRKLELLIDAQGVEWETVVAIIDAAAGVGIKKVQFLKRTDGSSPSGTPQ
jgi:biopolymer transport protein ExbD